MRLWVKQNRGLVPKARFFGAVLVDHGVRELRFPMAELAEERHTFTVRNRPLRVQDRESRAEHVFESPCDRSRSAKVGADVGMSREDVLDAPKHNALVHGERGC
jgi:hypothetical protein